MAVANLSALRTLTTVPKTAVQKNKKTKKGQKKNPKKKENLKIKKNLQMWKVVVYKFRERQVNNKLQDKQDKQVKNEPNLVNYFDTHPFVA